MPLKFVEAQVGEWENTRGGSIELRSSPLPPSAAHAVDVLIFRGDSLGDLVDHGVLEELPRALTAPLPVPEKLADEETQAAQPADDPLEYSRIVKPYRDSVGSYGDKRLGFPLGGTALVLAYRKSALEGASETLREAARKEGVELQPPATWEELDALARFLHGRDWDGDGEAEFGIAIPLGEDHAESLGLSILLARAAALGLHRDYFSLFFSSDTMEPWIDRPPFQEAALALAGLQDKGPEGMKGFGAAQAREAFRSGKVALLIDRPEMVHNWVDREDKSEVGVAQLPGSYRVFEPERLIWESADPLNRPSYVPEGGGILVGVSTKSEHKEAARDFARYLIEKETAARMREERLVPMLPIRTDLIGQGPSSALEIAAVDRRAWSDAVSGTFLAERVLLGLRIPEASEYLADLEKARLEIVTRGELGDSLSKAAEAWASRTSRLGVDRQLWHYRRSLLGFSTSPEPPPRP